MSDGEGPPTGAASEESSADVREVVEDPARLAALRRTGLLDSGPEEAFDRLTRFASHLLDVPVALVSLVDRERQYFKSAIGLPEPWASSRQAPLADSICQQVVAKDAALSIDDVTRTDALNGNRANEAFDLVAYAGAPIRGAGGEILGAFCVIDFKPRPWDAGELEVLEQLAAAAAGEIELRNSMSHALRHDRLTGLPNRDQFVARLAAALGASQGQTVVMAIDVPILDAVTDSLGTRAGETLLIGFAARLAGRLPSPVVARVGDDLFALLCASVDEAEALERVQRARDLLAEPFEVDGHALLVRPNIGLVLGDRTDDAEELLAGATSALRHARERPRRLEMLDSSRMRAKAVERLTTENSLRLAIQRKSLKVVYQPKLRLADGALAGFEALARWEDPHLGHVPPTTFIPIAEASGLIAPLGELVLLEACRQAAEWRTAFPAVDLSMAVNLSTRQVETTDVGALVADVLTRTGLPAKGLTLEITESVLMERQGVQLDLLRDLAAMGVGLALDDFGTGYSSLSYIATLPLNALKIDRTFVSDLESERVNAIVRAIVSMATALELGLTAEGIETRSQLDELIALGCGTGQGFLLCRPQSPIALEHLLVEASGSAKSMGR